MYFKTHKLFKMDLFIVFGYKQANWLWKAKQG